jgi:CheY-like chemotaxis protein/HPt (histidine-containing phosphotransfer) domain-containing protein
MDGKIGVESRQGEGARFWFEVSLPRFDGAIDNALHTASLSGLRVLVVDDNATNREILQHLLEAWNITVSTAESGRHALNILRTASTDHRPYDLVILDMHMPEMDGLAAAKAISAEPQISGVRMIMLSSVCQTENNDAMRAAGILCHLTKPARQFELYECISNVMQNTPELLPSENSQPKKYTSRNSEQLAGKVLLVEDNAVNLEVAQCMLVDTGCQVSCAANGQEALELLKENQFDLVLMDCQMPVMDGFEATRIIRELESRRVLQNTTPVIALTANAMAGDRERCLEAGMNDYLSKPLAQTELNGILSKWLPQQKSLSQQRSVSSHTEPHTSTTSPTPSNALINNQALDNIRNLQGGEAILLKVIDIYLGETPLILKEIRESISRNQPDAMYKAAHKLKSSSANLGAERLAELCRELEALGRTNQTSGADVLFDEIETEYALAHEALVAEQEGAEA